MLSRGAGGARRGHVAKGHATTGVHVGAHVGHHVAGRFADGGPTGIVGPGKKLGVVTQMRYRAPIFNRGNFHFFLRVGHSPTRFLHVQDAWQPAGRWIRSKRQRSRGPESTRSAIKTRAKNTHK